MAATYVHELFHTLKLQHPFDPKNPSSDDSQLESLGNSEYSSKIETDPNIEKNIMMYTYMNVDGKGPQERKNMTLITKGQIEHLIKEIDIQETGAGVEHKMEYYKDQ